MTTACEQQSPLSSKASSSPHQEGNSSSVPAGPIAGGVIGGCVVIVIPIVVWLILRHNRKRRQSDGFNSASASMTELQKPPRTAQSQNASDLSSSQYVEMEAPATELALGKAQYSHELSYTPANPLSVGDTELQAVETSRNQYSELDGTPARH